MTDYKGIKGFTIQTIAGDPPAPIIGQVWYNTTSNVLKGYLTSAGAWAAGGALNTGRGQFGLTGTVTAAIAFGGIPSNKDATETYNGTAWSTVASLNTGIQYNVGFGTTTAAVNTGGAVPAPPYSTGITEIWDGTSWTTSPATLGQISQKKSASNQAPSTTGIVFGGGDGYPLSAIDLTEQWDGSAWTELADLATARSAGGGGGTQTAAFLAGGLIPPNTNSTAVEIWNGTAWSEDSTLNTGRQALGSAGTTTSAVVYGGTAGGPVAVTEQYNGTAWTEVADLATAREGVGRGTGASGNSGLAAGFDGSPSTITEVWDGAPTSTVTFTSS